MFFHLSLTWAVVVCTATLSQSGGYEVANADRVSNHEAASSQQGLNPPVRETCRHASATERSHASGTTTPLAVGKAGWVAPDDFIANTAKSIQKSIGRNVQTEGTSVLRYKQELTLQAVLRARIAEVFVKVDRTPHSNSLDIVFSKKDLASQDSKWKKITCRAAIEIQDVLQDVSPDFHAYWKQQPGISSSQARGRLGTSARTDNLYHWIVMAVRTWDISRVKSKAVLQQFRDHIKTMGDTLPDDNMSAVRNLEKFMTAEQRCAAHFEKTEFGFQRFAERFKKMPTIHESDSEDEADEVVSADEGEGSSMTVEHDENSSEGGLDESNLGS